MWKWAICIIRDGREFGGLRCSASVTQQSLSEIRLYLKRKASENAFDQIQPKLKLIVIHLEILSEGIEQRYN